jgi:hypothetical protein
MTELSGFSAAQPVVALQPQALQLPTSLSEVCDCESNCGASRILKGLAQVVGARLTNLIEIDVQAVDTPEKVQVTIIPWAKDGVAKNGAVVPGGWLAINGTNVVGMSHEEYCAWTGTPLPEPPPEPPAEQEPEGDPPPA